LISYSTFLDFIVDNQSLDRYNINYKPIDRLVGSRTFNVALKFYDRNGKMLNGETNLTREKIMRASARLFSEKGYHRVTTREIAKACGIKSATIYYHFSSKKEILKSLFSFYTNERFKERPDVNKLLLMAEELPPFEVLMQSEYHYETAIREVLDQILITAARDLCTDHESEQFVANNIFGDIEGILKPLLNRLVELGKIEPFDIDVFIRVMSNYCFSTAALHKSVFRQGPDEYREGMAFLFSVIKPISDNNDKGTVE
jgi:AcrR family transcriptional regulator